MKLKRRHGDLDFRQIDELPNGLKKKNGNQYVLWEYMGNKHVINISNPSQTNLEVLEGADGKTYISVVGRVGIKIIHDQRNLITFYPGFYEVDVEEDFDIALESWPNTVRPCPNGCRI